MSASLSILYVDDEPDIRTIVEISLGLDPDIDLKIASSGAEALDFLAHQGWRPDLALVDMMMPGMSGIELLGAMRDRADLVDIPIVFVTASARTSDLADYVSAGAMSVISKPFDPMTLAETVRNLWAGVQAKLRG